ncbi:hypothetical protein CcI156_12935 [Frankia sp. CcI156]|uniref:Uncharacterized protein n=2 Tax=Frankiaceae TaxID=74712 RepID=Q2JBI2_FRACC|nr:hypothetical protein Francci3_1986 [Frankia casuarinae]ETA01556.1 hypothetical protein CcI6DRAFT_03031 [Frankia sp. CcI6]KDA42645.1 hypothetical protein BMG523Draft_02485 [Frankia sp. BMG5.23]KEZ35559.1 hypothetical protein CEDDRAFT_03109 [Frankia sp. CeD]KFB04575.1 hypothetical protein ALLO2DRAFT_02693 [Frankia sp. Allo2]OHV54346.1 hypothetical protein CgIS1_12405 [Frankia sp. CgIS1]ONH25602.1 hypothetical protein CcI156_12935 [Frankia sp. CcI156]
MWRIGRTGWAALRAMRTGWGILLVAQPGLVLRAAGGHSSSRARPAAVRVLGARHLVQSLLPPGRLGVAADCLHAASMLAFAAAVPGHRRLALADSVVASAFAASAFAAEQPTLQEVSAARGRAARGAGDGPGQTEGAAAQHRRCRQP